MNIFVIGTSEDVRGFSLAGVAGEVCDTREAVERCVAGIMRGSDEPVLIFSRTAADLISDRCAQWRRDGSGPPFEVLPG